MRLLHTFAVLGGDARQHYLAELLTASGFTVHTFAVPELPNTAASFEESVSQADAVCLPTPAVTSGAITGLSGLTPAHLLSLLPERAVVFGGGLGAFKTLLQRRTHPIMISCKIPSRHRKCLSPPKALLPRCKAMPIAIRDSAVLVTGFGRIGKPFRQTPCPRRARHNHDA